ncbi:hypothetical protein PR202_ga08102 [Eleusine coracana subsp. coracana]|uniref:Uncharacterized protein n=1 Tax=Eleusine coracana subsp. coracana TaxID=191504 RepID=A0AAV5C0W8_ELECO|nr:hypothetical protein PR202_ga08102 [Eleusine coracana subsp. coracana]
MHPLELMRMPRAQWDDHQARAREHPRPERGLDGMGRRVKCGRAVVEELVALGAAVHTCSCDEVELCQRLAEWEARGCPVTGTVCDISVRDQRDRLIDKVTRRFSGKLDILVSSPLYISFYIRIHTV